MPITVIKSGQQYGPYEFNDLTGYVSQGSFSPSDFCWQDGWEDWRPISSIIPYGGHLPSPPPSPQQANRASPKIPNRKKVQFSPEQGAFVGDISAIVRLAVRAVAESGYTLQNANDSVGMVTFLTGMTMSSFQGAICSITFIEIDDNVYRPQTAGKQNLGGAQLMAIDMGSANTKAQKVVSRMIELTGGGAATVALLRSQSEISNVRFTLLLILPVLCLPGAIVTIIFGVRECREGSNPKGIALVAVGGLVLLVTIIYIMDSLLTK